MKTSLARCMFALLVIGQALPCLAEQQLDESKAEFLVLPDGFRQVSGKYPDSHVVFFRVGCGQDDQKQWQNAIPRAADVYSIDISGAGYAISDIRRDDECTVSFDLKISSTEHGSVVAIVRTAKEVVGKAFLHFVDPLSGPIPTHRPKVDVLWAPISYDVCNQAFGRAVAKKFYCLALKIGNNSGYQLQIAGVGFNTPFGSKKFPYDVKTPNSSYALTRAVAQEGSFDSPRSYVLHGIEAAGLLMASATPYFHNQRSTAKFATATSIVAGPLEAAFNLLVPDHSLRQANNLDDQSLRDGRLIPNNSQITTVVFLDKGSVTLDFKSACDRLYNGYDVASVSAVKVHHEDQRQDELQEQQQSSTFATLESKSVAAKIGSQNKQAAKRYESCAAGDSSALKEALGALILVGDEIQFLERVVVDQSVRSQETPVGAQPDSSTISYQKLSITGRNLDKLPGSLNIISGTTSRTATRDTTSTAEAATYSFKSPLPSNAAYTVNAAGSGLPIALHGNVTNPDAQITGASITNDIMTVTGSELDLLSGALTVSIGDKPVNLQMSAPPSATTATYTLDPARDTKAKFAIESKPGVKVNPSPLTPTVK